MIVSMKNIEEVAGVRQDAIHVSVNNYRTHHGKTPEWYVKTKAGYFVDVDMMFRKSRLENEAWNWATDPNGLYWAIRLYLPDMTLARKLAARSHLFKSERSWYEFLTKSMWNVQPADVIRVGKNNTPPMIAEVIRHMMDILHGLVARFGIREWEISK